MPTLSSEVTHSAAQAQSFDQAPQAFSESLLVASKVSEESSAANDGNTMTAPRQRSASKSTSASGLGSDIGIIPTPEFPQRTVLLRQGFDAQLARIADSSVTSEPGSLAEVVSSSDVASAVNDQPAQDVAAPRLEGTGSTIARPEFLKLDRAQSTQVQRGTGWALTASTLSGADAEGKTTPIVASSKVGINDSNARVKRTTNSIHPAIQNEIPNADPNAGQASPLMAFSCAQPSVVPNATSNDVLSSVQSAASNMVSNQIENSSPKSTLEVMPWAGPSTPSDAAPNKPQSAAPNLAPSEMQNPPSKSFLNAKSSSKPIATSNELLSTVQSAVPNAASIELQNRLAKAGQTNQASAAPDAFPNAALNAAQSAASATALNGMQNPFAGLALSTHTNTAPSIRSNVAPGELRSGMPDTAPIEARYPLPQASQHTQSSTVPSVRLDAVSSAFQSAPPSTASIEVRYPLLKTVISSQPNPTQGAVQNAAPNEVQNPLTSAFPSTQTTTAPSVPSIAATVEIQNVEPNTISNEQRNTFLNSVPRTIASSVPSIHSHAVPNGILSATTKIVANDALSSPPKMVADASSDSVQDSRLNADPVPVSHAVATASAKANIASAGSPVSTDEAVPPAVVPDGTVFATGLSISGSAAERFIALTQLSGRLLSASQAGVSSLSRVPDANLPAPSGFTDKNGVKKASSGLSGMEKHAPSASDQAGSETGSQGAISSGDQNQSSPSSQGQYAAPAQMVAANHSAAAIAHMPNTADTSPVQIGTTLPGAAGPAAKTPDPASLASTPVPQALPVINTAKLIQAMGQSEMRVGIRTNEFGSISINTSATRDSISAQISLDHSELAKVLAAHLPEMQARLSGNQAVDVRIDMSGARGGLGTGTSGGFSNGSSDESRGGRQQAANAPSSYSGNGLVEREGSTAISAIATSNGRLNTRLDIRV